MATTGTRKLCGTTVLCGTGVLVGQGEQPDAWIMYSLSAASETSPVWVDATSKVRSFSVSRGRENELASIDAGTATIRLDNRTRLFDPAHTSGIRPMNRWWIREQFTGETQSIFYGYADSYEQTWRQPSDAETVVQCTDEFKVLNLDRLPVSSPPRDSYQGVVESDNPGAYWTMDDDPATLIQSPNFQPSPNAEPAVQGVPDDELFIGLEESWWKPGYPKR